MKTLMKALVLTLALGLLAASAFAAEVVQGKCTSNNPAAQTLTVEEYDLNFSDQAPYGLPTGIVSTYDISTSKVGLEPEPGDILRIAYLTEGDKRVALKVMNVSKQDLRKK